jgi:hypothetical protein
MRTAIVVYYEKSVTGYYTTYHHVEEDSNLLCYVNHLEARYARPVVTHCGGTECLCIRMNVSVNRNKGGSIFLKFYGDGILP